MRFLHSAYKIDQIPSCSISEVALLGRSNAGKSSLINALAGQSIAKTSSTPGKTISLNWYEWSKRLSFVDFPGYGYSKRPPKERKRFQELVESFLATRGNLNSGLLLIDCRRKISADEEQLANFFSQIQKPLYFILTKADKLNQKERHQIKSSLDQLNLNWRFFSTKKPPMVKSLANWINKELDSPSGR